jgi:hypothetical protein
MTGSLGKMNFKPGTDRAEIYAMAKLRIQWFEKNPPAIWDKEERWYATFLLDRHFKHVDRLIDEDIR